MASTSNADLINQIKAHGLQGACKYLSERDGLKTSRDTLLKDLDRLFQKFQQLNKSKARASGKQNLERFLQTFYTYPIPKEKTCRSFTSSEPFHCGDSEVVQTNTYKEVAFKLAGEIVELRDENMKLTEELDVTVDENDQLNESIEVTEGALINKKKDLKRTSNREDYWRQKCMKMHGVNTVYTQEDIDLLHLRIQSLEAENKDNENQTDALHNQIHNLEEQLLELAKVNNAEFFDEKSKTYSLKLHSCVYDLLDNHVAYEHVNPVIKSILNLVNIIPNKLPSVATIHNWSIERGLIAKRHIAETANDHNTTLHTDEASKYGQKWGAFATRNSEGEYTVLGLKDMATKSSHDTLGTFQEILKDIDEVSDALLIPSSDSAKNHDLTPGSIRRSNSSPSVLSGSSDTLSPRDSISDVVQFGPVPKPKSVPKSSDSDKSDIETKITISIQTDGKNAREVNVLDNQKAVNFNVASTSECDGALLSKSVGTNKSPGNAVEDLKPETGKNGAVPKEYTSMLTRQLSPSPASSEASSTPDEVGELPTTLRRPRGHTVAVTQPSGFIDSGTQAKSQGSKMSGDSKVGVSPSFVFLQLYHNGQLQVNDVPLLLPNNEMTERAIKMLDHIYPYETHKIGIIYVGPGQTKNEKAILSNTYGSDRYVKFIHSLGRLFRLKDCNPQRVYLGGLDTKGNDGEFTYGWQDESTQLIFHIATLMPNKESDPNCNTKKLHIGNDYVTVVYNDSEEDYKIGVIKGQFNYVNIVIKPLDHGSNAVTLQAKEVPFQDQITTDIAGILGHTDTKVISDLNLSGLVRQIAIHCNLASMVLQRQASQPQDPFANNWLERLRKIKRMRRIVVPDTDLNKKTDDFTQYV